MRLVMAMSPSSMSRIEKENWTWGRVQCCHSVRLGMVPWQRAGNGRQGHALLKGMNPGLGVAVMDIVFRVL